MKKFLASERDKTNKKVTVQEMMAGPQKSVSYMFFSSEDKAMIREFSWKCLHTLKVNKGLDLIHPVASNCCNCKTFITTFISLFLSIFVCVYPCLTGTPGRHTYRHVFHLQECLVPCSSSLPYLLNMDFQTIITKYQQNKINGKATNRFSQKHKLQHSSPAIQMQKISLGSCTHCHSDELVFSNTDSQLSSGMGGE